MLFQAQRDLSLDLGRTYFIGDDERDAQAAEEAGCPFIQATDRRPLLEITHELISMKTPDARGQEHPGALTRTFL
jgi:phosphoglycolate phosphatase-like HAD superfamily hydrolase